MTTVNSIHTRLVRLIPLFAWLCGLTAAAQVPGSALDQMLQRPAFSKHYKAKRFGDRLFFDGGIGLTTTFTRSATIYMEEPGAAAQLGIGDWVTPEHGWRIGFQAATFRTGDVKAKAAGISLDYLLNFTALSHRTYAAPLPFELHGTAGLDYWFSRNAGENLSAPGFHLGLRGQAGLSDYTYFYFEPRIGIYGDDLFHLSNWRGYRPAAHLLAGFGYRLRPETRHSQPYAKGSSFLDGAFFSVYAGPGAIVNSDFGDWHNRFGARAGLSFGKWFDPFSGVRLSLSASTYKQPGKARVKAIGIGADYLWNMHNTFGGYNPDRRFWLNALAGVSANASTSGQGREFVLGAGGGVQANFRLGKRADFFLEPRLDVYKGEYAAYSSSAGSYDATASLLAGFTVHQPVGSSHKSVERDDFVQKSWFDHLFVEAGAGIMLPATSTALGHPDDYVRPAAYAAVGKWLNAVSGVQVQLAAGQLVDGKVRRKTMSVGADYLLNLTNAVGGYHVDRRAELVASVGLNGAVRSGNNDLNIGGTLALKGIFHINSMWGVFLSPQLRLYGKDFMRSSGSIGDLDATGALLAGIHVSMNGYVPAESREAYEADPRKSFYSVAGGVSIPANSLRESSQWGPVGRLSYGRWFAPASAWRANIGGLERKVGKERYAKITAGADYMADLSTLAFGYNEDRSVSLRALAGLNLGMDYSDGKARFAPDIHAGGQLAVRVAPRLEVYAEPQLSFQMGNRFSARLDKLAPSALLGLNWKTTAGTRGAALAAPAKDEFISFGVGTGAHTETVLSMSPFRRKFTLDFDLSYGRWLNGISGFRLGLSDATIQKHGEGNKHVTALHADYLFDIAAAVSRNATDDSRFQLDGFAGVTLNAGSRKGNRPTWGVGLEGGLQVGMRLTPKCEIYLEPAATLTSKTITRGSGHPAEGQVRLMLGTKYNF